MNSMKAVLIGIGWLLVAILCFLFATIGNITIFTIPCFVTFAIGIIFLLSGTFAKD